MNKKRWLLVGMFMAVFCFESFAESDYDKATDLKNAGMEAVGHVHEKTLFDFDFSVMVKHEVQRIKTLHVSLQYTEKIFYGTVAATALSFYLYKRNAQEDINPDWKVFCEKLKHAGSCNAVIQPKNWLVKQLETGLQALKNAIIPTMVCNVGMKGYSALKEKCTGAFDMNFVLQKMMLFESVRPLYYAPILYTDVTTDQAKKEALRLIELLEKEYKALIVMNSIIVGYVEYQNETLETALVSDEIDRMVIEDSWKRLIDVNTYYVNACSKSLTDYREAVENKADSALLVSLKNTVIKTLEAYVLNVGIEKQEFEKRQHLLRFDSSNINKTWIHSTLSITMDFVYHLLVKDVLSHKIKSLI